MQFHPQQSQSFDRQCLVATAEARDGGDASSVSSRSGNANPRWEIPRISTLA
jgi:hypothetical protein